MLRTRVTVLAGFLGSGKTTLLNALLRDTPEPLGVIVNDFGAVNIDAALVSGHTALDGEVALHNGCICCTIRGDLLAALLRLRRRKSPPAHIIIEASGVSDPAAIARTFADPRLAGVLELAAVVGCVDPTTAPGLVREDWDLACSQLKVCDLIVSTKHDIATHEEQVATREVVRAVAPRARVVSSSLDSPPTALVLDTSSLWDEARIARMPVAHEPAHVHEVDEVHGHHHHHGDAFVTWTYRGTAPLSVYALRRALLRLPVSVFRAKGFVHVAEDPNVRLLLHVVGARAELRVDEPWTDAPHTELVFLGREGGLDREALETLLDGCVHDGRPAHAAHMEEMLGYFNRLLSTVPGHLG